MSFETAGFVGVFTEDIAGAVPGQVVERRHRDISVSATRHTTRHWGLHEPRQMSSVVGITAQSYSSATDARP